MKKPSLDRDIGTIEFLPAAKSIDLQQNRKKIRILVVDDEKRHRDSLKDLISLAGFQPETAGSGKEAIDTLGKGRFDLMLLDLRMPEIDGHQVLQHIQSNSLDTGVIIISGEPSWDEATKTLRRGADDFIRKPYAPDEVLTAIENSLKKRHLERENSIILKQLQTSERLHRFIVNHSPDLIYILDEEGRFRFLNDRIEELLGFKKQDLLNKHFSSLLFDGNPEESHIFNERRTGDRASRNIEVRLKSKNQKDGSGSAGQTIMELTSMGVYTQSSTSKKKEFIGTYGVARDVTERKKAEELINFQAYHDLLTGLPNRALFKDRLGVAMKQATRSKSRLAVMFLDLDRFKLVNDTLGHTHGDKLLQSVAERIKGCIRDGDTLSRIGGDEFTLLLPSIQKKQDAEIIAEKILSTLRSVFVIGSHELFVRASIGIALFPEHGKNIDTLIKRADMAMYEVKGDGKDNYGFYSSQMDAKYAHKLSIESGMRKALEENQFEVHYQPQVRIEDRSLSCMEALIRWNHPERGYIEPTEFIPHAEENGLIIPIGKWVLETVLSDLSKWRDRGLPLQRIAVNISALQLEHPEFVDTITKLLKRFDMPGSYLELEITENAIMKDMETVVHRLKKLTGNNVHIAIDDFGTGYSSLSYLQTLPIHTLKMDQSFVNDIDREKCEGSIISAIVAMARGLQLKLVAEGVEKETQAKYLQTLGCEGAQGYLFSTPLTFGDATVYMEKQGSAQLFGS